MSNISSSKSLKVLAPKLRFPEFTEPWQQKQLKDLCICRKGRCNIYKSEFISTENMNSNFNGVNIYDKDGIVTGVPFLKGDTLIGNIRPYLKKVWKAEFNGGCSTDVLALHPTDIDSSFFYHLLARNNFINYIMTGAKGSKMPRGDKAYILNYEVGFPSKDEQYKISFLNDLLDSCIKYQQEFLKLLNMYKRGVLNQIFGQMTVDQISIKLKEVINPLKKTVHQAEEGKKKGIYPFFTNSTRNTQKYIDAYDYDDCVIIANTGGNAKFRYFDGKFAATSDCYIFKTNQNTQYIYYLLEYMTDRISKRGFRGNGIKHLDKAWFLNMDINIHLSEKQEQIASFLSMLDVRIQKEEHILEQLKMIKTGLLQQMFV